MRLFTAVLLSPQMRGSLSHIGEELESLGAVGRFTPCENLHVTLVFIGETPAHRLEAVKSAMNNVSLSPFTIRLSPALGRFRRPGGDILWAGLEPCEELEAVQKSLAGSLRGAGLAVESREYRAHITLGRDMRLPSGWDKIAARPCSQEADRISLMLSERTRGRMVYTEIHSVGAG